jgi:Zn-dependent oligopeptidase
LNIEGYFAPGVTFKLNSVAPPQVNNDRVYELTRMKMMAFFYFITFNKKTKRGGFWTDGFYPLSEAHHGDWGNFYTKHS